MDFLKELEKRGAILKGHFLLTSGLHSNIYFEKFRILDDPSILVPLMEHLLSGVSHVDWVIGPVLGGAIMAIEGARILRAKAGYAESVGGKVVLRRGFGISKGDRILVVDDVLTTGSSIKATLASLQGHNVIGVYVIIDRSENDTGINLPLKSLIKIPVRNFTPEECPMCRAGIPLERRGGLKKTI